MNHSQQRDCGYKLFLVSPFMMTLHHQGCPPLQGCVPLDAALVLRQVGAAGALSHGHCVAREEAGGGGPGRRGRDGGGRHLDAAEAGPELDVAELVSELLAHAAVDGEVERAGETHEGVDDENDIVGSLVIHPVPILNNDYCQLFE